ncbi:putative aflatoxin efflux pump [Lophiostoma macrostomum CBS 122681]|uniref:Putative aflatoxin efflux pump n=1 Tax=Lophiostoma macrostomum CBS 122681 TaxID=1314788 RepID=A0A6A6T6K8_9PLEO|nr:putative aflatoxin efflux pump [Lophiostoma macrostomum CBS 122681]
MLSLYISMFLISLDRLILSTAIPRITDTFSSLADISWYGSAYMLTLSSFQLPWGKVYTFYNPKLVFLVAIFLFELGSTVCGAAPSSVAFIVGRAIAGLGAAGIMNGAIIIIVVTVPLAKRPVYQGLLGAVFGVSSVAGPLLGGLFTEKVSWRWCFYINLPCGAVAVAVLILCLHLPKKETHKASLWEQFKKMDPLGTACLLPSVVCLLLALQWGGTTYPWGSWRIILLFVLFGITFIAFLAVQIWMPDTAILPMRILLRRTIAAAFLYTITSYPSMFVLSYYIPIFFQALKNWSPVSSGLANLPFMLSLVISLIGAGGAVKKLGYPAPFMIASSLLAPIGAGLITTWPIDVRHGMWIGYQVLSGFGLGLGMMGPNLSAQIVLPKDDVPLGVSLMTVGQNLGGAIWLSVAQNLFADDLASKLSAIQGLGLDPAKVVQLGATEIRKVVPEQYLAQVLVAYRSGLQKAFYLAVGLACVGMIGAVSVEWRSVKEGKETDAAKTQGDDGGEKATV